MRLLDLIYWPLFWRWNRRVDCHNSVRPCQHIDHPKCNPTGGAA